MDYHGTWEGLYLEVGYQKQNPISIAKWIAGNTEVGEAHRINDAKDNKTFVRKGALL